MAFQSPWSFEVLATLNTNNLLLCTFINLFVIIKAILPCECLMALFTLDSCFIATHQLVPGKTGGVFVTFLLAFHALKLLILSLFSYFPHNLNANKKVLIIFIFKCSHQFSNKSHYVMKMMINKLFYSEQYTTQRTLQCHQNETIAVAFGIELKITLTFYLYATFSNKNFENSLKTLRYTFLPGKLGNNHAV